MVSFQWNLLKTLIQTQINRHRKSETAVTRTVKKLSRSFSRVWIRYYGFFKQLFVFLGKKTEVEGRDYIFERLIFRIQGNTTCRTNITAVQISAISCKLARYFIYEYNTMSFGANVAWLTAVPTEYLIGWSQIEYREKRRRRLASRVLRVSRVRVYPGARFPKVPKTFRSRKAIPKTPTSLFCKAGFFHML